MIDLPPPPPVYSEPAPHQDPPVGYKIMPCELTPRKEDEDGDGEEPTLPQLIPLGPIVPLG